MVDYVSCRDASPTLEARRKYSFRDAIFAGWAEDGGMLMPSCLPVIPVAKIDMWRREQISYSEMCYQIVRLFIPTNDISDSELHNLITVDAFEKFGDSEVVRNRVLQNGTNVLELWHGNTLAFKDLGMQCLCKLLQYYLVHDETSPNHLNLLVGTSGDTGSSAIEAVKDLPDVTITVLYPQGRGITRLQELQMTVVGEETNNGVHVIGVEGSSDDLDRPMEAVFSDVEFKKAHSIGSVNSVNICRVVVQIAHYVWSAVVVAASSSSSSTSSTKSDIHFYVPTGAGGHVTAGVMARQMLCEMQGTELHLHVATNSNDIFHNILSTGSSHSSEGSDPDASSSSSSSSSIPVVSTISPSMDIQIPYNLERLLWMSAMFSTSDESEKTVRCVETARLMKEFKQTERIMLGELIRERIVKFCGIRGSSSHNDESTKETIRQVYMSDEKYVLDPHTAIGVRASILDGYQNDSQIFCMACAHPSKFSNAIEEALSNGIGNEGGSEKWWWLSDEDKQHTNIGRLLELDLSNRQPVCEEYKLGTNWEQRLKEHFVEQTKRRDDKMKV